MNEQIRETLRRLAYFRLMTAAEREMYHHIGGTIPRNIPPCVPK